MNASPTPALTDGQLAFLQARVSRFNLVGAVGVFTFYTFRLMSAESWDECRARVVEGSMVTHLVAALILFLGWLICRSVRPNHRVIRGVETVSILGSAAVFTGMGQYVELGARPDQLTVLAIGFTFLARSIYVPSSARRTLVLGTIAGAMMIAGAFRAGLTYDPSIYTSTGPEWRNHDAATMAGALAMNTFAWWVLYLGLCTGASSVLYGLRKQVYKAQQLGQYTLIEKLGEGGMGVVYRARHALLRRPTAVKLLPPEKAGSEALARFEREVQRTADLSHPNIVTVFDYGRTHDGVLYYAMELLDGATIAEIVQLVGPLPPARVLHVMERLAWALTEAHAVGLIHRDIKPANVLLCVQGRRADVPKLVDFGLVKQVQGVDAGTTATGTITGTPLYMAPEALADPDAVDERSDLYALGALGYFMLTGTHVFTGKTTIEVCSHHLRTPPEPPSKRLGAPVPERLEALLMSCLRKAPADRPQTAEAIAKTLAELAADGWDAQARRAWWTAHHDKLINGDQGHRIRRTCSTLIADPEAPDIAFLATEAIDFSE